MICRILLPLLISFALPWSAIGQKLPNVQQTNLRSPANIKIDGKATEWKNKFEAHNHTTGIFYPVCNNDENSCLIVQASDHDVLTKITNKSVQFAVNSSHTKSDGNSASITFPVFDLQYSNKPYIRFSNASGLTYTQRVAIAANPHSVLNVANKKLHDNEKYIRTSRMPGIDTLISIYNNKEIVAREGFDRGMIYTYEMAILLKSLKLSLVNRINFLYHIILRGLNVDNDLELEKQKCPMVAQSYPLLKELQL